ncbi:MAG TPA: hypothetical protein VMT18_14330 [Planctomycetota bacterium]|nr:hypothetical protein [Planctomycetota bacterium]
MLRTRLSQPQGRDGTALERPSTHDTMEANDLLSDEALELESILSPLDGDYDFDDDVVDDDEIGDDDDDDEDDDDDDFDDDDDDEDDDDEEDELLADDD